MRVLARECLRRPQPEPMAGLAVGMGQLGPHYLGPRHSEVISDILLTWPAVRTVVHTTVPSP